MIKLSNIESLKEEHLAGLMFNTEYVPKMSGHEAA